MSRLRYVFIISFVAVGFLSAFLSGYFLNSYFTPRPNEFPILNQSYNILINHSFLDLPGHSTLEYGMIRGLLLSSEDPYATFQEPVQHELESNNLQGSFGGIGVELTRSSEGNILVFPISNGPAFQAGIHKGDQLLWIDDIEIGTDTQIDEIKAAIRGPVGKSVKIIIARDDHGSELEFNVRRDRIHLPSVTWHVAPEDSQIGIININIIAESTTEEIKNAVREMQKDGTNRYILDLRDNGGGLLTAGIDTARLFLHEGVILQQQYRGEDVETFTVKAPGPLADLPLVILINHNTASAAEIVAGALQKHHRALLIGEPSFGKDSIQLIFDLQDGSSLHVTAAKWWIPGLSPTLGEGGLQPDLPVSQDESGNDLVMISALEYLREQ
jgi:carboxyl-terminal processing protease